MVSLALRDYGNVALAAIRGSKLLTQEDLSHTINVARVALVVGVIFNHYGTFPNSSTDPTYGMDPTQHQLATFVSAFLGYCFSALIAIFAAMSGYLFFSLKSDIWNTLRRRLKTRFRTLVIPLVFWNCFYMFTFYVLFLYAPNYPLLTDTDIDFRAMSLWEYVDKILGITAWPLAYQFWFVRDLFITILFAPLTWFVLQRAPWTGAVVVGLIWITNSNMGIFFRPDVFCFYYFGGLFRTQRVTLEVSAQATIVLLGATLLFAGLRASAPLWLDPSLSFDHFPLSLVTRMMRIVAVIGTWGLFIRIARTKLGTAVVPYAGPAFFLFCIHVLLIGQIKILLWPLIPAETDAWMLVHYFASVFGTILAAAGIGLLLLRVAPGVFSFVTGNRSSYAGPANL